MGSCKFLGINEAGCRLAGSLAGLDGGSFAVLLVGAEVVVVVVVTVVEMWREVVVSGPADEPTLLVIC